MSSDVTIRSTPGMRVTDTGRIDIRIRLLRDDPAGRTSFDCHIDDPAIAEQLGGELIQAAFRARQRRRQLVLDDMTRDAEDEIRAVLNK